MFVHFAKYLLHMPPWHRSLLSLAKFKVADPEVSVTIRIVKHDRKMGDNLNDWSLILKQRYIFFHIVSVVFVVLCSLCCVFSFCVPFCCVFYGHNFLQVSVLLCVLW